MRLTSKPSSQPQSKSASWRNQSSFTREIPPGHLFLLLTGRARRFFLTQDGEKVVLLRVTPRELFGEAAVLAKPVEYLVSSEAMTPISALVWNRGTIRGLCERYPRLMENALLISFDYLAAYRAAHASLICNSAPQRLAQVLANLADGIGQKVPGGVELDVRNEEIANEANISFFTASRLLSAWQREGILVKRRGKVLLHLPWPAIAAATLQLLPHKTRLACFAPKTTSYCKSALLVAPEQRLDLRLSVML